jgi:hypothetical protein
LNHFADPDFWFHYR